MSQEKEHLESAGEPSADNSSRPKSVLRCPFCGYNLDPETLSRRAKFRLPTEPTNITWATCAICKPVMQKAYEVVGLTEEGEEDDSSKQ